MKRFALLLLLIAPLSSFAKEDWQSDLRSWTASSQTDPNCKVRYTTGIYRPDLGDRPQWGMMTEKMFKWFSKDGVKRAPSVCPTRRATAASYRILFSQTPMKTVSHTTHGSETRTTTQPFNADVNSSTTYSDGSTANSTATITGQQTTTVVVPTETTISRSSVALYMYTYRVKGEQLELIATDSVVFSRVSVSGSGDQSGAILGAGIRNLVNKSGDSHRADKLYEQALNAIRADAQDYGAKQDASLENYAAQVAPAPLPVPVAPSAASIEAPKSQGSNTNSEFPSRWKSMTTGAVRSLRFEKDYIYAETILPETAVRAGVFFLMEVKKDGEKYTGKANGRIVRTGGGASCTVTLPYELTLVTSDRIEGRSFAPPQNAKIDWNTCSYSAPSEWRPFAWIPVK
jgi:hypothetical protein